MIDVSNLKDVLNTLGFVAHGDMYEKAFPEFGCSLKVSKKADISGRYQGQGAQRWL